MNFDLSEDDAMIKALAERFVLDRYQGEARRDYLGQASGFSPDNWRLLGELGLLAGLGEDGALPVTAIAVLFEAFGRGLVVEPLIENVVLALRLFGATAPAALRDVWLDPLISGERRIALALAAPNAELAAARVEGGYRLTGNQPCVPAGQGADAYLVTAQDGGDRLLLFIAADAPGVTATGWRMADGRAAVSLRLEEVFVPDSCRLECAQDALDEALALADLARGAEALGIMERLFADTLDYLRTREQFGVRIGSFQAIQHRMAMQYAALEQARGLLNLALVSHGSSDFAQAVAGLRAFLGTASIALGHEAIQFHGGMGVSDELAIGQGHKRLLVLSRWPDDPDSALDKFAGIAA